MRKDLGQLEEEICDGSRAAVEPLERPTGRVGVDWRVVRRDTIETR